MSMSMKIKIKIKMKTRVSGKRSINMSMWSKDGAGSAGMSALQTAGMMEHLRACSCSSFCSHLGLQVVEHTSCRRPIDMRLSGDSPCRKMQTLVASKTTHHLSPSCSLRLCNPDEFASSRRSLSFARLCAFPCPVLAAIHVMDVIRAS